MPRILLVFAFCLCGCLAARAEGGSAEALCTAVSRENRSEAPVDSLSRMTLPTFQGGGLVGFKRWVMSRLTFPAARYKAQDEVHAAVTFTIDTMGRVTNAEVTGPAENSYSKELLRAVSAAPAWTPALVGDDPVEIPVRLQFDFKLQMAADAAGQMSPAVEDVTVYTNPDAMPVFEGGSDSFADWLLANLDYNPGSGQRAVLRFVVEKFGSMSGLTISGTADLPLKAALTSLCAGAPAWKPGMLEGEPVRTRVETELVFGDAADDQADPDTDAPFLLAEVMPSFRGGDLHTFRQWVQSEVVYPPELLKEKIQGRVVVTFIVGKDGAVTDIGILRTPHPGLSAAAISVLRSSPRWIPGKQAGRLVCVKYVLPVDFRISTAKKAK